MVRIKIRRKAACYIATNACLVFVSSMLVVNVASKVQCERLAPRLNAIIPINLKQPNSTSHIPNLSMKQLATRTTTRSFGRYICRSCSHQAPQQRRGYATESSPEVYDVVCVGGGPAGLSVLAALSKTSISRSAL